MGRPPPPPTTTPCLSKDPRRRLGACLTSTLPVGWCLNILRAVDGSTAPTQLACQPLLRVQPSQICFAFRFVFYRRWALNGFTAPPELACWLSIKRAQTAEQRRSPVVVSTLIQPAHYPLCPKITGARPRFAEDLQSHKSASTFAQDSSDMPRQTLKFAGPLSSGHLNFPVTTIISHDVEWGDPIGEGQTTNIC